VISLQHVQSNTPLGMILYALNITTVVGLSWVLLAFTVERIFMTAKYLDLYSLVVFTLIRAASQLACQEGNGVDSVANNMMYMLGTYGHRLAIVNVSCKPHHVAPLRCPG
jgi:hypothetical protein